MKLSLRPAKGSLLSGRYSSALTGRSGSGAAREREAIAAAVMSCEAGKKIDP
jgi:hypothetical protein